MRGALIVLMLATTAWADMRPVGAVREIIQYAIELPDQRICVLSSQRLALIDSADATEVRSSAWLPNTAQRAFVIHGSYAYVPHRLGVAVIRIHPDRLEHIKDLDLRYATRRPPRLHGDKLLITRGREILVYGLADSANPEHLKTIKLALSGGDFALGKTHLFACSKARIDVYDLATFALVHEAESPAQVIGATHVRGDSLFVFADIKLYRVDIRDPLNPITRVALERQPPVSFVVDRPEKMATFHGYSRHHVSVDGDATSTEIRADEWPLVSDAAAQRAAALAGSELWTLLPMRAAAATGDHLVLFDSREAHVYDIADFAKPRFVARVDFRGTSGEPIAQGDRIYTRNGVLELSDPAKPKQNRMKTATAQALDGNTLYQKRGQGLSTYAWDANEMRELGSIPFPMPPSVFAVRDAHLYYVDKQGVLRSSQIVGEELHAVGELVLDKPARAVAMSIHDDVLYLSSYDGLRAIDIKVPSAFRELAFAAQRTRNQGVIGRDRCAFTVRLGTGVVAMDLVNGAVLERGPVTSSRYLQLHRGYVFAGLPVGGVGIFHSPTLAKLEGDAKARAKVDTTLARAKLAADQGSLLVERELIALAQEPQTPEITAWVADFQARRQAERQALVAAKTFTEAHRKQRFCYFQPEKDGQIRAIRVGKPDLFREHGDYLSTLPVQKLDYMSGPLGGKDLALIGRFTQLQELRVRDLEAPVDAFAAFANLQDLRHIDFRGSDLPLGALANFAELTRLDRLDLDSCAIQDADVAHLSALTELTFLSLQDCPIGDHALAGLRELRKLRTLDLGGTRLRSFANLAMLSSVEVLRLQAVPATEGFEALAALTNLQLLDLSRTAVNDTDLAALQPLRKLKTLLLSGAEISDASIPHIAKFPELEILVLDGTALTDAGLEPLTQLPKLRRLYLRDTAATDAIKGLFPDVEVQLRMPPPREAPEVRQEKQRLERMPEKLAFRIIDNELVLSDAETDAEFAREAPTDLFDKEPVSLRGLLAWEGECWIGSDRGLLRFEPHSRVWSRFAVDRQHLNVPIHTLERQDDVLIVRFGQEQEARFHLQDRRWLLAAVPVAEPALPPATASEGSSGRRAWFIFLLILGASLMAWTSSRNKQR